MKRKLTILLALFPLLGSCADMNIYGKPIAQLPDAYGDDEALRTRFRGVTVGELVTDSLTVIKGVVFYDDRGYVIDSRSVSGPNGRQRSSYPGGERGVPTKVRATWRENPKAVWGKYGGIEWEGAILGDYTVSVAERIPDETLDYIRQNKTSLRLKFRLYDMGILVGWDVPKPFSGQRVNGRYYPIEYVLVGGDFKEAHIVNGKVVEKGWYIDNKTGQKIETDY